VVSADFCSLKIKDRKMMDELFFGIDDFDTVKILHEIDVTDIIYPNNMDSLKPAEIREMAKRKGIIKRIVVANEVEKISQAEFIV